MTIEATLAVEVGGRDVACIGHSISLVGATARYRDFGRISSSFN